MAPKNQENSNAWPFLNPAYDSYTNPTAPHEEPYLVSGLNVRTSSRGWLERAPGSASYEGTATDLATWRRTFVYRKWNGDTYIMASRLTATQSLVYKLKVGTDTAFQLLYTSTLGATATSGPNSPASFGAAKGTYIGPNSSVASPSWTNYLNVFASDNARAASALSHPEETRMVTSAAYGFNIPVNATIVGITAEIEKRNATAAPGTCEDLDVYLFKNAVHVGSNKAAAGNWPTSDAYTTYGGAADVWGTTWTPEEVNASGFGVGISAVSNDAAGAVPEVDHMRITIHYTLPVQAFDFVVANNTLYYGNGGETRSYDGTLEKAMGITAPTAAPTMTNAGSGITATVGWRYVYCYKDSIKGHISSPSPTSASTGAITDDTITVTVTGVAVSTGVDKIQIFRSTDGGNGIFFYVGEIDNPGATTDTYADTTADSSLNTQFSQQAPPSNYNDPAPAMLGLKHFANRVWGFVNSTLYYSGWEEINAGREEESFPSGVTGNSWEAPQEIMALATIGGDDPVALMIFCRSKTFMVTGDSRLTFSFHELFSNIGTPVKVTGVAEDGDRVFFMGNDNRVYSTDGRGKQLVSEAITDDLLNVASTDCAMVVHRFGEINWLIVADDNGGTTGAAGARWYVLDLTTGKWQAPWAKNATHLFSGETSTGNTVLLYASRDATTSSIIRKLSVSPETPAWTDANGGQGTYTANAVFSLTDLVPSRNPKSVFECTGVVYKRDDTNSPTAPVVRGKFDELNAGVTWASQTATTQTDIALRTQGTRLVEKVAQFNPTISGRNLLVRFEWSAENLNFKLLGMTLLSKEVGPQS